MRSFPAISLFALLFTACNKELEQVPLSPFSVYPNPFPTVFHLSFDASVPVSADVDFRLTDGNEVLLERLDIPVEQTLAVNADDFENGVYFIEVTIDGQRFVESVLKAE